MNGIVEDIVEAGDVGFLEGEMGVAVVVPDLPAGCLVEVIDGLGGKPMNLAKDSREGTARLR